MDTTEHVWEFSLITKHSINFINKQKQYLFGSMMLSLNHKNSQPCWYCFFRVCDPKMMFFSEGKIPIQWAIYQMWLITIWMLFCRKDNSLVGCLLTNFRVIHFRLQIRALLFTWIEESRLLSALPGVEITRSGHIQKKYMLSWLRNADSLLWQAG